MTGDGEAARTDGGFPVLAFAGATRHDHTQHQHNRPAHRPCRARRRAAGLRAVRLHRATWTVTHPRGGLLPCCNYDLDDVLNDALGAIPLHSTARIEVYRP